MTKPRWSMCRRVAAGTVAVLGQTLDAIGDEAGADDAYAYADDVYAAYESCVNDPC